MIGSAWKGLFRSPAPPMVPKTKKLLYSYDPSKPNKRRGEFLCMAIKGNQRVLVGIKSGRVYRLGRVVYIGLELDVESFLASINRSDSFAIDRKLGEDYFTSLASFKIGNVLSVGESDASPGLVLFSKMGAVVPVRLPA